MSLASGTPAAQLLSRARGLRPSAGWIAALEAVKLPAFGMAIVAIIATAIDPAKVWTTLGDTDDATRLLQVRALLDGQGWFDTRITQFGAGEPYLSHWSRLLDAPLAVLLGLFDLVMPARWADTALRWLWPLVPLLALLWLTVHVVRRSFGETAATYSVVLIATSQLATFQFFPGRIDHHNVQMLCTFGAILLLYGALDGRRSEARLAGVMFGLSVAIGYEAMPLSIALLILVVAIAAIAPAVMEVAHDAIVAFAVTLAAAFVLTVAPWAYANIACDALSLNLVAFAGIGAAAVAALRTWGADWPLAHRFGFLGLGGLAAFAVFGAMESACLAGPQGQFDAAILPIWHDHIRETRSLFELTATHLPVVSTYLVTVITALLLLGLRLRAAPSAANLFAFAAMLATAAYGCVYAKLLPYPMWPALAVIACGIAMLGAVQNLEARTVRIAALTVAAHPIQLALASLALAGLVSLGAVAEPAVDEAGVEVCLERDDMAALNALPPGLVLGQIDLGPHIAAHTRHRVVVAPYHRMADGLKAWHRYARIHMGDASVALRADGIDYVVLCLGPPAPAASGRSASAAAKRERALPTSMADRLMAGGEVPGLVPIAVDGLSNVLKVWRVAP